MKTKQHISGRFLLVFTLFFLLCGTVKTSAATAPGRIQGLKCGITTKNSVNLSWQGQSAFPVIRSTVVWPKTVNTQESKTSTLL